MNKDIKLANELSSRDLDNDVAQDQDPQMMHGLKNGYTTSLLPNKDYAELPMNLDEALQSPELLS